MVTGPTYLIFCRNHRRLSLRLPMLLGWRFSFDPGVSRCSSERRLPFRLTESIGRANETEDGRLIVLATGGSEGADPVGCLHLGVLKQIFSFATVDRARVQLASGVDQAGRK